MKLFGFVTVLGSVLFLVACTSDSPLDPDSEYSPVLADEKSADAPAGHPEGYVLHANQDAKTRRTYKDARILFRAALEFTEDNGGWFVRSPFHENLVGRRMIDYLPGGRHFKNAITGYRTEPQDRDAATPGQIGYIGVINSNGWLVGFIITAFGATPEDYLVIEYIGPGIPSK